MGVELHRRFPFVDVVVDGEADHVAVALVNGFAKASFLTTLSGVTYRARGKSLTAPGKRPPVDDMDALPIPDHDDFIRDFKSSSVAAEISPQLVMETSRGCWWGQKHHCTFCGLNGQHMSYRSKSPDTRVREIVELIERYGIFQHLQHRQHRRHALLFRAPSQTAGARPAVAALLRNEVKSEEAPDPGVARTWEHAGFNPGSKVSTRTS